METVVPQLGLDAFNCPHCGAYAHMTWWPMRYGNAGISVLEAAMCSKCDELTFWRKDQRRMVDPLSTTAPRPAADMPEDVRKDYVEAAAVFGVSPRAAAALLRLALQRLCVHLGEKGDKIDVDIRELAKKGVLPQLLIKVADTVRITGNNAVHPGEMDPADVDFVASKMFQMINLIVHKGITEPAELQALYEMVPESARAAAEKKDAQAAAAK